MFFLLFFLIGCTKNNNQVSPDSAQYSKSTIQYKHIDNVEANLLSMDIYHFGQTTARKPVVIYVHGGGFSRGDKANNIENKVSLFSSLNYIFISLNYRLSPTNYSTDPNRIMYPIHHNDIADAITWITDSIDQYGGDKNKIALLGHSAGAQLVALVGTSSRFLPMRKISLDRLCGVACIDTEGYDVVQQCIEKNEIYLNAFGQDSTFWREASPIFTILQGISYPHFFIAKRGSNRRINYANSFITKLQDIGVKTSSVTVNQYDHEGINDAIGASGETLITTPLVNFLKDVFQK
jgi:acetyl esterase/lipase